MFWSCIIFTHLIQSFEKFSIIVRSLFILPLHSLIVFWLTIFGIIYSIIILLLWFCRFWYWRIWKPGLFIWTIGLFFTYLNLLLYFCWFTLRWDRTIFLQNVCLKFTFFIEFYIINSILYFMSVLDLKNKKKFLLSYHNCVAVNLDNYIFAFILNLEIQYKYLFEYYQQTYRHRLKKKKKVFIYYKLNTKFKYFKESGILYTHTHTHTHIYIYIYTSSHMDQQWELLSYFILEIYCDITLDFHAQNIVQFYELERVWFGFYGISSILGYLILPNPLYRYILNIYDL